jgi:tetratricopeptide (TPR) repeat protein
MTPDSGAQSGSANGGEPAAALLGALGERHDAIARSLREAQTEEARGRVKGEIIAFFRDVDALHEQVGQLRERIRLLVDEYRAQGAGDAPAQRAPVHNDGLNSSTYVERGWNLIAAEKNGEAVEALEKALALAPANLEAEGLLGWALMKAGRYDRALKTLEGVLRADPANEMARVNLGYICLRKKIYGEALAHLNGALEESKDRKATIYALHYLGLLHAERGEVDEAMSRFQAAIEAGPNLIEAYYHLGLLLYRNQKVDQARAIWQSAVERNAYNLYAKRAKAALEDLESGRPLEER